MSEEKPQQKPAPWATMATEQPQTTPWWQEPKTVAPLVLLLIILLLVVFWLPTRINPAVNTNNAAADPGPSDSTPESINQQKPPLESPWTDAQLAKQRREAQDILARLLDHQRFLENAAVQKWNKEQFEAALTTAAEGDELYKMRDFQAAKKRYLEAEKQLQTLVNATDQIFSENFSNGQRALKQHNIETAQSALTLAAAIQPENSQVASLLNRANNLEAVLKFIKQSDQALALGNHSQAQDLLRQAKSLDPEEPLLEQKQVQLNQAVTDKQFSEAMSLGFIAMQSKRYSEAISQFKHALTLKPAAPDAATALKQAQNSKAQQAINNHIQLAEQAIRAENWEAAIKELDNALAIDKNLVDVKIEKIKATARLQLHNDLNQLIKKPLQLSEDRIYRSASRTLADAKAIKNPGPKLTDQIATLSMAINAAQVPIEVQLKSDNLTKVTLYRVGQLGNFDERVVNLKPGLYTIVGSRTGYRDVRKEFTVTPNASGPTVTIACQEKINQG